jgi:hypothetical protein
MAVIGSATDDLIENEKAFHDAPHQPGRRSTAAQLEGLRAGREVKPTPALGRPARPLLCAIVAVENQRGWAHNAVMLMRVKSCLNAVGCFIVRLLRVHLPVCGVYGIRRS